MVRDLDANGKSRFLRTSFLEISATSSPAELTTGSLPFLLSRRISLACGRSNASVPCVCACVRVCVCVRLDEGAAFGCGDELFRHDRRQWLLPVLVHAKGKGWVQRWGQAWGRVWSQG